MEKSSTAMVMKISGSFVNSINPGTIDSYTTGLGGSTIESSSGSTSTPTTTARLTLVVKTSIDQPRIPVPSSTKHEPPLTSSSSSGAVVPGM